MGWITGRWAYHPTLWLQFSNLIFGNIGLVILAGQCLKVRYVAAIRRILVFLSWVIRMRHSSELHLELSKSSISYQ